jgi:hypothetical protein
MQNLQKDQKPGINGAVHISPNQKPETKEDKNCPRGPAEIR